MRLTTAAFLSGLLTVTSAHFQLQYPPPRGPFVEDDEPTFCDGYPNSVSNRSMFPTSNGFISIFSEHPRWTLGGAVATVQNANTFDTFKDNEGQFQYVLPFFQTTASGDFCVNVNLSASGIEGIQDGANVTIQLIFDGGDGQLYQCADLTLSENFTIPSSVSCNNATENAVATPVSTNVAAPTQTSPSSTGNGAGATPTNSALRNAAIGVSSLAGFFAAVVSLL